MENGSNYQSKKKAPQTLQGLKRQFHRRKGQQTEAANITALLCLIRMTGDRASVNRLIMGIAGDSFA
jgi:hypothetical protein